MRCRDEPNAAPALAVRCERAAAAARAGGRLGAGSATVTGGGGNGGSGGIDAAESTCTSGGRPGSASGAASSGEMPEAIDWVAGGRTRLLGRRATRIVQPTLSLYGSNDAHVR